MNPDSIAQLQAEIKAASAKGSYREHTCMGLDTFAGDAPTAPDATFLTSILAFPGDEDDDEDDEPTDFKAVLCEVSEKVALQMCCEFLEKDATRKCKVMDPVQAEAFALRFFAFFDPDTRRCFSNRASPETYGKSCLSWVTCDTGIYMVDSKKQGVLWVGDGD